MCHKLCTESLECTWGKEKDNDIERNKEGRTWRLVRIPRELLIFLLLGPIVMFRLVNVWQELCFYLVLPLFHVLFWVLPVISKRTCRHRQRGTAKICDIYKIFFFVSKNVQEIYVRGAFSLLLPFFVTGWWLVYCFFSLGNDGTSSSIPKSLNKTKKTHKKYIKIKKKM